jgi:biopolymer transport protein ExbD
MSRHVAIIVTAMLMAGCATMQVRPPSFEQAVLTSIDPADKRHQVVIQVDKDGGISVGGRPTALQELEGIRKVAGLPEDPPAVLIRANREAKHADIRAVMNAITKAGIWKITFAAIREDKETQNQQPEGIRR